MTTEIGIQELEPLRLLSKRVTCATDHIGPTFAKTIGAVGRCMREGGGEMRSAPISVYFEWRDVDCDMAAACVIDCDVPLSDGCEWLDLVGGAHASASHFGPYDSLSETHTAIIKWIKVSDWDFAGPCRESYHTDPSLEPDTSKWQTCVFYPVTKKVR